MESKKKARLVKDRFGVELEMGKGVVEQVRHAVNSYVVEPVLQPISHSISNQANKLKKKLRRNVRQAVDVATIRSKRLFMKFNGHFDEIQRELKYEIYRQYVDHHVQIARDKAKREFSVIETGECLLYRI